MINNYKIRYYEDAKLRGIWPVILLDLYGFGLGA